MKTISSELAQHIAQEVTTLATCWKMARTDGVQLGFTEHDADLVIDGLTYRAATGFTPSAVANSSSLSVDNLDVEGMLSDSSITEEDIMAGKYDFAEIHVFMVNYRDLTQGKLKLRRGWLGEVSIQGSRFVAEVRGLAQRLSQTIGEIYSPSCRATLGDARCKVDMEEHTFEGEVTASSGNQSFQDSARTEGAGIFTFGNITFTGGENDGLSMEIKEHGAGGRFTLALPLPYAIGVGDAYTVTAGCDKTLFTCSNRFENAVNFRGEPHVPGLDRIFETAGTRSNW